MRKNNIIVSFAVLFFLIVFGFIFLMNTSKSNPTNNPNTIISKKGIDTLGIDSKEIKNYFHSYIKYVDRKLSVIVDGIVKYEYIPKDSCYVDFVNYDRIKGFISFNECKNISEIDSDGFKRWIYTTKVIDYKSKKIYDFDHGESADGESWNTTEIINFNPIDSSRILISHAYESLETIFYFDKKNISLSINPKHSDTNLEEVIAVLDTSKYLISVLSDYKNEYLIYDIVSGNKKIISGDELISYNPIMLKQFGRKYYKENGVLRMIRDMNSIGTASYNYNAGSYLHDYSKNIKYYFKSSCKIIPIW